MKKKLYFLFSVISIILVIWAIIFYSKKDIYNEFLKLLISPKTYEETLDDTTDLAQFDQNCKSVFEKHLNQNGLDSLLAARLPYMYQKFIEANEIDKVKNIQLNELKHSNEKDYTYSYYELAYTYESKDKEICMKDYFVIYLINKNEKDKINKVVCMPTESSIYRLSFEMLKNND
ncbi:hypothetical protein [Clostridium sp.]|uniref:hypothetical protein n=1 Tax=Clostridium sp. TaxID=1506 RepID=UPI003464492D